MISSSNTDNIPTTALHSCEWICPLDVAVLQDHFPDHPIIPAYLQLAHIQQVASALLAKHPLRFHIKRVKFLKPIPPGASVRVRCELLTTRNTVKFSLVHLDEVATHGEVVWEGSATTPPVTE